MDEKDLQQIEEEELKLPEFPQEAQQTEEPEPPHFMEDGEGEGAAEDDELDLDAIMREFGGEPAETEEQPEIVAETEQIDGEPEADVQIYAPEETEPLPREEVPQTVTGDTIRLDKLALDTSEVTVKDAAPILEEETEEEPFSDQWEPEYEQPMGEYVPPQPIQFQPRSRLRELKRQIVAGPEKRYYELVDQGLGKLQAAIFFSLLVVLLCIASTAMYAFGLVQEERLRLMIFGQFFAMLLSALLGSNQLIEGVADLFKGRFTLKTLLVATFILCCADGVLCLRQLRVPCCAAFALQMTMALCNTYQRRLAEMGQMDTLRKAVRLDGIGACPDYYQGKKAYLRYDGNMDDFMNNYQKPSKPEKVLCWYALAALLAAAVIGVVAGVFYDLSAGIQVAAVTLLAAAPASAFITLSRPYAILTRRLRNAGAVLCGWQGVEGLCGRAVYPLSYSDLFPNGAARMNGVKFFGKRQPDEIVAYCTAVIDANHSGVAVVFDQVLDSRNGYHYDAVNLHSYDNGGIGGEVNGEAVLVGSLSFLKEMGVEIQEGIHVNQAVCVAIDGELCGLFALSYENTRNAAVGFALLCGNSSLRPVIATDDFLLTEQFLRSRFSVKSRKVIYPPYSEREALREKKPDPEQPALALITRDSLAAVASSITGARSLRTASHLGVLIHIVGGAVGVAAMVLLTLLGRLDLLTPANLLAYHLVWLIPGWLLTEWTRS